MTRVGIAGFGFMGQFHYRAYREVPDAKVVALFDFDPQAFDRAPIQGNLGSADMGDLKTIPRFTDYGNFLEADFDVVDLCLPTFVHREFTEKAFASGRAVLCEKPMALSVADCEAMIAASQKAKKLLMVAQCIRFWPGFDLVRDAVRSGSYGKPLTATLRRIGGAPTWSGWFLDEKRSGGGVLDCLVHDFDFARCIFGKPSEVSAGGTLNAIKAGSGVSYCRADLRYGSAPPPAHPCATIEGGWVTGSGFPFSMSAFFQFEQATLGYGIGSEGPLVVYHADGRKETPTLKEGQGYEWEIRYFLECLKSGKPPAECPPEESRDAIAMALAARDSVASGKPVRVT